jgi:Putative phage tail protein
MAPTPTLLLAIALLLASATQAQAGFLVAAVVAAIGITGVAATIVSTIATVALAFGVSWAATKLLGHKQQDKPAFDESLGVELDMRLDADVPQSLIVGRAVTAGSLAYAETYGSNGEFQNTELIQIIALADHPCTGLVTQFAESQEATLQPFEEGLGHRVDGYNQALAIRFYDGSQTAADTFTVSVLGSHSERPWTAAMVGRGITYVRARYVYDRNFLPGPVRWRFVLDGIRLYDPRLDSSVGGSGPQRFNDLSTHQFSKNLAVIAYNILRGIRVADAEGVPRHFYGLENTPAANLPLANWFAAMNECDVEIDGEPQFHGGAEISVDTEPLTTVKDLLRACDGRLSEVGGVYKLHLGSPGLPVISFDDGVLRANEDDRFKPILPLEQRINYVTGSYLSPEDGWLPKVAPPRRNADAEAADGRRVPADLQVMMVQSDAHMQRIMQQMLRRVRNERRHTAPLPPEAWGVEPGDIVEWAASERNGYVDKLFEVDSVDDYPNFNSTLALIEVDPDDYDWSAGTDLIETSVGSLVVNRPAPRVVEGFDVDAYTHQGDDGVRRPAIKVSWTDPEDDDAVAVSVQVRRPSQPSDIATANAPDPAAEQIIILASLTPDTDYEVRARFVSFNGYPTDWSLWSPVTTPDERTSLVDLQTGLRDQVTNEFKRIADRMNNLAQIIGWVSAEQDAHNWIDKKETRDLLTVASNALSASIEEVRTVAVGTDVAFASFSTTVTASLGGLSASVANNSTAVAAINGQLAAQWTVSLDVNGYVSGLKFVNDGSLAGFTILADLFQIAKPGVAGGAPVSVFTLGTVGGISTLGLRANVMLDGSIIARMIAAGTITANEIAAGSITADRLLVNSLTATQINSAYAIFNKAVMLGVGATVSQSHSLTTTYGTTSFFDTIQTLTNFAAADGRLVFIASINFNRTGVQAGCTYNIAFEILDAGGTPVKGIYLALGFTSAGSIIDEHRTQQLTYHVAAGTTVGARIRSEQSHPAVGGTPGIVINETVVFDEATIVVLEPHN